ncbi:hypothetical protein QPK87_10520 [Kamptonema cortianum]|nr:hypothetical protein [Geitlerinema splendidum]MDK3157008.1 hypothetical protein [Kamptonema cortianum]
MTITTFRLQDSVNLALLDNLFDTLQALAHVNRVRISTQESTIEVDHDSQISSDNIQDILSAEGIATEVVERMTD